MQGAAPLSVIRVVHVGWAVLGVIWLGNAVVAPAAAQTRARAGELRQAVCAVEREQVVREAIWDVHVCRLPWGKASAVPRRPKGLRHIAGGVR